VPHTDIRPRDASRPSALKCLEHGFFGGESRCIPFTAKPFGSLGIPLFLRGENALEESTSVRRKQRLDAVDLNEVNAVNESSHQGSVSTGTGFSFQFIARVSRPTPLPAGRLQDH